MEKREKMRARISFQTSPNSVSSQPSMTGNADLEGILFIEFCNEMLKKYTGTHFYITLTALLAVWTQKRYLTKTYKKRHGSSFECYSVKAEKTPRPVKTIHKYKQPIYKNRSNLPSWRQQSHTVFILGYARRGLIFNWASPLGSFTGVCDITEFG